MKRIFTLSKGLAMPEPEKKFEISFSSIRNGDRLGHDHLDSVDISTNGYRVTVNEEGIFISLPIMVSSLSSMYRERDRQINEALIFQSYGQVIKAFLFKEAKDGPG